MNLAALVFIKESLFSNKGPLFADKGPLLLNKRHLFHDIFFAVSDIDSFLWILHALPMKVIEGSIRL